MTETSDKPDGSVLLKEVTLLADAPIHVISPSRFLDVGRMGMGNSWKFTFIIKADNNAANAMYFMTLKVRTDDGDVYVNYPIAIKVDNTPLNITISNSSESFTSDKQTVTLDVVNNRADDVSGVAVVPSGDGVNFNPQQQYIIGEMGAGDMYTAQFDITVDNTSDMGDPS